VHQEFRLPFPLWFPEKIPCFLMHQHVRYCRHLIDQKSLLKDLMRERNRHWYSPAWFAYSYRSYPGDLVLHGRLSRQDLAEPATAKRHSYRYRSPILSPRSHSLVMKIRIDLHGQPGLAGIRQALPATGSGISGRIAHSFRYIYAENLHKYNLIAAATCHVRGAGIWGKKQHIPADHSWASCGMQGIDIVYVQAFFLKRFPLSLPLL
jgi:hypothetical protein